MNVKPIVAMMLTVYLYGCASHEPIIDTDGVDMNNYETDLSECQQYAEQVNVGGDAAVGAGLGAALGWALSAVSGNDNNIGAKVGAVSGGAAGLGKAATSQQGIIKRCLQGRGYRVLN